MLHQALYEDLVYAFVTQMQRRVKDEKERIYLKQTENQKKDEKKLINIAMPVSTFKMKSIHDENAMDKDYFDRLNERIADFKVSETLGMHKQFDNLF